MFRVFYSWMSDHPGQRMFVYRALDYGLKEALGRLPDGEGLEAEVVQCGRFSRPTDIVEFILSNIGKCHAYVVDVTFVNKAADGTARKTPNPNNMLEFGVALQSLGRNCCIPVFNSACGSVRDLPFDIQHLYTIEFDRKQGHQRLGTALSTKLEHCVKDYLDCEKNMCSQLGECLATPIGFLGKFLREHYRGNPEDASIMLLSRDPSRIAIQDFLPLNESFFFLFKRRALSETVPSRSFSWLEGLSVLLTRLQADCERMCYRFPNLTSTGIYAQTADLGKQAGHIREIIRPLDKFDDPYFYEIFAKETVMFLNNFCRLYLQIRDTK